MRPFHEVDWNDLKIDLPFWTNHQLEIFTEGILIGVDFTPNLDELDLNSIQKRTELIPELLSISQEAARQHNDIALHISENLEFIAKGEPKSLIVLRAIQEWDNQLDWMSSGQKVRSPNEAIIELEIKKALNNTM